MLSSYSAYQPMSDPGYGMGGSSYDPNPNPFELANKAMGYNPQMGGRLQQSTAYAPMSMGAPQSQGLSPVDSSNMAANDPFHVNFSPSKSGGINFDSSWMDQTMPTINPNYNVNGQLYGSPISMPHNVVGGQPNQGLDQYISDTLKPGIYQSSQSGWGNVPTSFGPGNGANATGFMGNQNPYTTFNNYMDPYGTNSKMSGNEYAKNMQAWSQGLSNMDNSGGYFAQFMTPHVGQLQNYLQSMYQNYINQQRATGAWGSQGNFTFNGGY